MFCPSPPRVTGSVRHWICASLELCVIAVLQGIRGRGKRAITTPYSGHGVTTSDSDPPRDFGGGSRHSHCWLGLCWPGTGLAMLPAARSTPAGVWRRRLQFNRRHDFSYPQNLQFDRVIREKDFKLEMDFSFALHAAVFRFERRSF